MNESIFSNSIPVGPLNLVVMNGCEELGDAVDRYISEIRTKREHDEASSLHFRGYCKDSYKVPVSCPRFGSGEAKGSIKASVRGSDMYILTDVMNHSITYSVNGHINHMSPDNHFQDLKRIIAAASGFAKRITVIMPFLYESRQHKRTGLESLDSSLALNELIEYGVNNIITFDAHDPRINNSIPLNGFDNFLPPYQFIKALLAKHNDIKIDNDHLMIISPDEGAMHRAVYFANVLGVDMGMFYKRRDYSKIINGRNPIVAHEFLGTNVEGKDVIIMDDMISSGESMLDTARELKEKKAKRVFICTTFGLFTDGCNKFDEYYEQGMFDGVILTNLTYRSPELKSKPYYYEADMSIFLATIIDYLNHDASIASIMDPTEKIRALVEQYNNENKM
ncbi:MAG: ribose-phosphate pyrophosphokinase [Butyrivibrio sp.]|nr:ribose-phosphate pyrophosphokinase [Butyrivibrio sp.]